MQLHTPSSDKGNPIVKRKKRGPGFSGKSLAVGSQESGRPVPLAGAGLDEPPSFPATSKKGAFTLRGRLVGLNTFTQCYTISKRQS